jgi:hypothetical protein
MSSATGHNLSQGDLESEGDSERNPANTGQGCYKNYEHFPHQRRNVSLQVSPELQDVTSKFLLNLRLSLCPQQHSVQEPEVQPLCPPDAISWHAEPNRKQDEQPEEEAFENEQLIAENDENSSAREPFMRASKAVSRT